MARGETAGFAAGRGGGATPGFGPVGVSGTVLVVATGGVAEADFGGSDFGGFATTAFAGGGITATGFDDVVFGGFATTGFAGGAGGGEIGAGAFACAAAAETVLGGSSTAGAGLLAAALVK